MPLPSLTADQASRRTWDVVVIGAGPAGSMAARELGRRGLAVLLVDKASFPRWKVCGACVNGRALATLAAAGLAGLESQLGAVPLTGVHLAAGNRTAAIGLPAGVALSRSRFDFALAEEAIRCGVAFLPQTRAILGPVDGNCRWVALHQSDRCFETAARVVLAADGLAGGVAGPRRGGPTGSRIGAGAIAGDAPEFYRPGTIFMACGSSGYVGMVRVEDGRLDIAAALDPDEVRRHGMGGSAARILAGTGWPAIPGLAGLGWRGTPPLTHRRTVLGGDRLLVLGDAAGYVEPFTGEGMAWAMAGAVAVAPIAAAGVRHWHPGLCRRWAFHYRQAIANRQAVCRAVAGILRRPRWTSAIVALLHHAPWLARPVVGYLNRPIARPGE